MRATCILLSALACASALAVLQDTDPQVKAASFFKLAYSYVVNSHDRAKYLVPRLRVAYRGLCVAVPDCDEALGREFSARYREVRRELSQLERTRQVLTLLSDQTQGAGRLR